MEIHGKSCTSPGHINILHIQVTGESKRDARAIAADRRGVRSCRCVRKLANPEGVFPLTAQNHWCALPRRKLLRLARTCHRGRSKCACSTPVLRPPSVPRR